MNCCSQNSILRKLTSKVTRVNHSNIQTENSMQTGIPFNGCETGLGNSIFSLLKFTFSPSSLPSICLQCSYTKYLKQKFILKTKVQSKSSLDSCCYFKGGRGRLSIPCIQQILMCPAMLSYSNLPL